MTDIAIRVDGLSKAYRLGAKEEKPETLVESLARLASAPMRNFRRLRSLDTFDLQSEEDDLLWALKDVSFEIRQGEVVGFVGRNGAGKSTLLKILSRIAEPTSGRVEILGRVSSLLEVGTGFHQELTGRENIYMNGTILGMKRSEIDAKFDEIVEFSGVERFLDTPVKRYSSGMKVRLAFAVAAHLEPEILIIDEVLAVGDAEFQRKCLGKMEDVATTGRTVLFVSHNMGALSNLCSEAIALSAGAVVDRGVPDDVIRRYLAGMFAGTDAPFSDENPERSGSGGFRYSNVRLLDSQFNPTESTMAGEKVFFELEFRYEKLCTNLRLLMTIYNQSGAAVFNLDSIVSDLEIEPSDASQFVRCSVSKLPLKPGEYRLAVAARSADGRHDHIPNALRFSVVAADFFDGRRTNDKQSAGLVYVEHSWHNVG